MIFLLRVYDGFISIEVLGGQFPYTISWTDGSGTVVSPPTAHSILLL